jgi:hypothetical protein
MSKDAAQRHADLIARLRKQAKEWEDESTPYRHIAESVDAKNRCGERLTDILDDAEQANNQGENE